MLDRSRMMPPPLLPSSAPAAMSQSPVGTLGRYAHAAPPYSSCILLHPPYPSCPTRYPTYVQDIMGDIFSLGFGPFRWVCTSCSGEDLKVTDGIAAEVLEAVMAQDKTDVKVKGQVQDNLLWIRQAGEHDMVVGSQARILYVIRRDV